MESYDRKNNGHDYQSNEQEDVKYDLIEHSGKNRMCAICKKNNNKTSIRGYWPEEW